MIHQFPGERYQAVIDAHRIAHDRRLLRKHRSFTVETRIKVHVIHVDCTSRRAFSERCLQPRFIVRIELAVAEIPKDPQKLMFLGEVRHNKPSDVSVRLMHSNSTLRIRFKAL